jgi:hypothetical protein
MGGDYAHSGALGSKEGSTVWNKGSSSPRISTVGTKASCNETTLCKPLT